MTAIGKIQLSFPITAQKERETLILDPLTRDIIRCLSTWSRGENLEAGQRPTYWTVSKKLKASPRAVKLRFNSLTRGGVLANICVIPDVSLFGLEDMGVFAMFNRTGVAKMKENLRLLDFIQTFHVFRPLHVSGEAAKYTKPSDTYFVWLNLVYKNLTELDRRIALLRAVIGEFPIVAKNEYEKRRYNKLPSEKNISLLRELCRSPIADISEIARKLKVSPKSARKYLSELQNSRAFHYFAIMDWSKLDSMVGLIVFPILDENQGEQLVNELKKRLGETWLGYDVGSAGRKASTAWIAFAGENVAEIDAIYSSLKHDKILTNATLFFAPESIDNQPNICYLAE